MSLNLKHFCTQKMLGPRLIIKGSVHVFWCGTYVKSPCLKCPPLKGFFFWTTRSAYRSRNVVPQSPPRALGQFFRPFSPLTAVPFEIEIFPWNMLNPPVSNFPPWKDFFFGPPVRPTGPETWCPKALRGLWGNFFALFPLSPPYPLR